MNTQTDNTDTEQTSKVHVNLGDRSYDIFIGQGLLENLESFLPFELKGLKVFVLTDEGIADTHGRNVCDILRKSNADSVEMFAVPSGEKSKSQEKLFEVLEWMLDNEVNRQSVFIAVGGGVIGDLGGFAASIVLRGIPYVQIPTTLLAQVDSSVGGKTAIDMPQGKNLVGTFYQPAAVICDLDVMQSLPERQLKSGYAEVVKYALINDESFFLWLEGKFQDVLDRDPEALMRAVRISCHKKAEIVSQDEKEGDARALLNLGHTFAHVFESYAGYDGRLMHGEAVAIGIVCAYRLSLRLGYCSTHDLQRVEAHLTDVGLPIKLTDVLPDIEIMAEDFLEMMKSDKKVYKGDLTFILTRGIGGAYISRDVPQEDVLSVLEHTMSA